MAQGLLPFKYEEEKKERGLTSLSGLLLYLDLFRSMDLSKIISKYLKAKSDSQGWSDEQVVMFLILLNLAGGDCVEDIKILGSDEGFCRILEKFELYGKSKRERVRIMRRWRKKREQRIPSPSSIFRYLEKFHDKEQENKRDIGKAFIPEPNSYLLGIKEINKEVINFFQTHNPQDTATIDMDATLIETYKKEALFSYKKNRSYHPLNVWWFEQEQVLYTEFRDGNVPAGFEQLRIFKEALSNLPEGVKEVYLRSDSVGYQHDLLQYCDEGKNERFGKIGFAIGHDIMKSFRKAILSDKELEWHPIYIEIGDTKIKSGHEWSEICYVPSKIVFSKSGADYRYIAIREELNQLELPGMEEQLNFPFPTIRMNNKKYKLTSIVSNLDWHGEDIIHWYRKRAGKSEEAHSIMKEDFAGGKFPSSDFGENAAWWWIMVLALNINNIMKQLVLDKNFKKKRMKAIRFSIINISGKVIYKSGKFIVRIVKGHPSFSLLLDARQMIMSFGCLPSG